MIRPVDAENSFSRDEEALVMYDIRCRVAVIMTPFTVCGETVCVLDAKIQTLEKIEPN